MSFSKLVFFLKEHPIVPTMVSFGILFPTANTIQQLLCAKSENQSTRVNLNEVVRYSVYGSFVHGPLIYNWVNFISRRIPGSTLTQVMAKVIIDQVCFAPVALSTFLLTLSALEGRSAMEISQQWKVKFLPTYLTGWCVWPILTSINYKLVPLKFRAVYVAFCNFFWTIFLAYQKSQPVPWKSPLLRLI